MKNNNRNMGILIMILMLIIIISINTSVVFAIEKNNNEIATNAIILPLLYKRQYSKNA